MNNKSQGNETQEMMQTFYCSGYVALPIIETCANRGLFRLLDAGKPKKLSWIIKKLNANPGCFGIALQILEALEWVRRVGKDSFVLTEHADPAACNIPFHAVYQLDIESVLFDEARQGPLLEALEQLLSRLDKGPHHTTQLIEGALLGPILIALHRLGLGDSMAGWNTLPYDVRGVLERLFLHKKWFVLTEENYQWSDVGQEIITNCDTLFRVGTYHSLLTRIDQHLFGEIVVTANDEAITSARKGVGHTVPDGMDNAALEQHMRSIFNHPQVKEQPRYIVDIACGNGTRLQHVYKVMQNSLRREFLTEFDVTLVGVDTQPLNVAETEKTLTGIPTITLCADLNTPQHILDGLLDQGMKDAPPILYIGAFLANKITCNASQKVADDLAVLAREENRSYIDSTGQSVTALQALSAWQDCLKAWATVISSNNLLVLESHHLVNHTDALMTLSSSDLVCCDAIRALSGQYHISAEALIVLAASVGLFSVNPPERFPKRSLFCGTTLTEFEQRDYRIRHAQRGDLESLYQLESLCWEKSLRTPEVSIKARVENYPQGQFVLEKQGEVVGVIYSQRINSVEDIHGKTSANVNTLHVVQGKIIQLLAVNIHPLQQNFGLGDQLLEFMLQRCGVTNGVQKVVAVTLCKEFDKASGLAFSEYLEYRDEYGKIHDPILFFHESHGAKICEALPDYREQDIRNQGYGVLIEYDIHNRRSVFNVPDHAEVNNFSIVDKVTFSREEIETFIETIISKCLAKNNEAEFFIDGPLMDMGLDSVDLLSLQAQIQRAFSVTLNIGDFFQYNTPLKLMDYIAVLCGTEEVKQGNEQHKKSTQESNIGSRPVVSRDDIAVIGMSCRLPGGIETPDEFWELLSEGRSSIGELPPGRFNWPEGIDPEGMHKGIDRGGFIKGIDCFDAAFFRISPKEAESMDPQQRILLELSWACLENAGVIPRDMKGSKTGVFIGASNTDYSRLIQSMGGETEAHHATGSSLAILANRISYFFDFCGPSLLIDTACSSSLVALHSAIQSLRNRECDSAVVGGVNLVCHPGLSIAYHKAGMLSSDGRCNVFDANANGYVRSEGAVVLLLKPLKSAVESNNAIAAVIKGSAVNHGGQASGLTVPNPAKQSELLLSAWNNAGIKLGDLSYIEAHGTGTSLGDPIEIEGILKASMTLGADQKIYRCGIGSVKSNVGHLESAAGITGLLKVILSMQHKKIPASINFQHLNPKINLYDLPFYIVEASSHWQTKSTRIAGVSSFGSGGANAHVIVEEWNVSESKEEAIQVPLFVLSAKSQNLLIVYAKNISYFLTKTPTTYDLNSFICTYQISRTEMESRLAIKVKSKAQLIDALVRWTEGKFGEEDIWTSDVAIRTNESITCLQGSNVVESAIEKNDLVHLANLWVTGVNIDFRKMYAHLPKAVAGPTHPFQKNRFWLKTEKKIEHNDSQDILGEFSSTGSAEKYIKHWKNIPQYFLFTQGEFSCLSLTLILELLLAVSKRSFPEKEINSILHLEFFPFPIGLNESFVCETRCIRKGSSLVVDIVHINENNAVIASATIDCFKKEHEKNKTFTRQATGPWLKIQESFGASNRMPLDTMNAIFPVLVGEVSDSVVIPEIRFYNNPTSFSLFQVSISTDNISVATSDSEPFLQFISGN